MPSVVKSRDDSITHSTMNHSNSKTIDELKKGYPIASEQILTRAKEAAEPQSEVCTPCITGKSKRQAFPQKESTTPKPLEVIGSDTAGPVNPADVNGHKYMQLFVDQETGYCTGTALKSKSQVGKAITNAIAFIQRQ